MKNILDGNCAPCSQFLCPLQGVCWRTLEINCLETCVNWSGDELGQRSNAKPRWAKPDAVLCPFCRLDTTPGVLGEVKKGKTDKGKMAKSGLNMWRRMGPVPMGTKNICGLTSLVLTQEVHITLCWKPLQGLPRSLTTFFPCG